MVVNLKPGFSLHRVYWMVNLTLTIPEFTSVPAIGIFDRRERKRDILRL